MKFISEQKTKQHAKGVRSSTEPPIAILVTWKPKQLYTALHVPFDGRNDASRVLDMAAVAKGVCWSMGALVLRGFKWCLAAVEPRRIILTHFPCWDLCQLASAFLWFSLNIGSRERIKILCVCESNCSGEVTFGCWRKSGIGCEWPAADRKKIFLEREIRVEIQEMACIWFPMKRVWPQKLRRSWVGRLRILVHHVGNVYWKERCLPN